MVKEASVFYSNVDPDSLIYKGEQFDHLHKVNSRKADDLVKQLDLDYGLPSDDNMVTFFYSRANENDERADHAERAEEDQLLSSGESKVKDLALSIVPAASLKLNFGVAEMTINLEKTIAGLGVGVSKLAVGLWGGTRTRDAPDITVLSYYLPVLKPLVNLGQPIKYENYEKLSEGQLLLTNPSVSFEFWTTSMPIFNAILFCGRVLAAGDINAGHNVREGFVHGILPPGPMNISRAHTIHQFLKITEELWIRGGTIKDDPNWRKWSKKLSRLKQCKTTAIRDLVRLAKEGTEAALEVSDIYTAAMAFGLAQVNLCKIMALGFGSGPRVYTKDEEGFRELKLEASVRESDYTLFYYDERSYFFRLCGVPAESLEELVNWLDNEVASTTLLGIENGDAPGTVVMTPSFHVLARTGAIKSLGDIVSKIGMEVAENCKACSGSCVRMLRKAPFLKYIGCRTMLFLNMLVTVYVGGVLKKAGMAVDQCLFSGDLKRTIKSLKELRCYDDYGLSAFLTSWYILRSGKNVPGMKEGTVLGLEMDGQIHGLRHAVKPGTTGSPLVSFDGHIAAGLHTFACLVYTKRPETRHELKKGQFTVVTEQPPDILPEPYLFIRSESDFIAVDTILMYPTGDELQVDLGAFVDMPNKHRCEETTKEMAVPLHVSQCVNGYSVVNLTEEFRYVLYTYGNDSLQSWIYGAFEGKAWFQGCRPLHAVLSLIDPGEILIQGGCKALAIGQQRIE